jgi:tetratricopeptide (TPR) repeat protein
MKTTNVWHAVIRWFWLLGFAVPLSAQGDGGQAGAFLRYGVGGRALGMGRAFTALSNDASGVFWNPAGLAGAERIEIATMYSNLYFDTRFSHLGLVLPRIAPSSANPVLRFLAGPASAVGIGWIGFGMTDFEQRTNTGELLGTFGLQENAFALAWAHESVSLLGLFRFGIGFKMVNQSFPGLVDATDKGMSGTDGRWSAGADAGFTVQPIHLLRPLNIRLTLPLTIGVSLQNFIRPQWTLQDGKDDPFPRVLRMGLGYRWVLRDWIPKTWEPLQALVGRTEVVSALDWEKYEGGGWGTYLGFEGRVPVAGDRVVWFPRLGVNNRTEGLSLGTGLIVPFGNSAGLRMDYAYLVHPDLPNDSRIFLSFLLGEPRDHSFFKKRLSGGPADRDDLLRLLAAFPNEDVNAAALRLAESDRKHAERYFGMLEGLDRAEWKTNRARSLLRENDVEKAKGQASDAVIEYAPVFNRQEANPLTDNQLMDYAEMLLLTGRIADVGVVLGEVRNRDLRAFYLSGTANKAAGKWDPAIADFDSCLEILKRSIASTTVKSIDGLAALGYAEALAKKGLFEQAMKPLGDLLKPPPARLDEDYLRPPVFTDRYCIDDIQTLMGICRILSGSPLEGAADLLDVERFYTSLDWGMEVAKVAEPLVALRRAGDAEGLRTLALELFDLYSKTHGLAVGAAGGR